jgi:hypothetical protein
MMNVSYERGGVDCAPNAEVQRKLDPLRRVAGSVKELCQRTETNLTDLLREAVMRVAEQSAWALGHEFRPVDDYHFWIARSFYELKIVDHSHERGVLCVSILPFGRADRLETDYVVLDGGGKYLRIDLSVPRVLAMMLDPVAEVVEALYASGYQWLDAHGRSMLITSGGHSHKDREITSELYSIVRAGIGEYAEHVALFALAGKEAFFLFDCEQVMTLLNRTRARRSELAVSPLEITSLMINRRLDTELTISRSVIGEGRPISENLVESRYADTQVNLAEILFYETRVIVCQPVVREARVPLTCAYPASMASEIAPRLDRIIEPLEDAARRKRFLGRRTLSRRSSSLPSAMLRETGEVSHSIALELAARIAVDKINRYL